MEQQDGDRRGPEGRPEVTIRDVADAASVSVRTVSRVLNQSPLVNKATRQNVQAVINRMGFSPSLRARALAFGRSYLIGMVHDDPNALSLDAVQRGIATRCAEDGYELVVHPVKQKSAELVEEIVRFARRSRVDGLILLPPISENADIPAALSQINVPVTGFASVRIPSYPAMLVADERGGGRLIGEHLIELGHRRIGMITGPRNRHSATERAHGFRTALGSAGVSLAPKFVKEGDYSFNSGLAAGLSILAARERPTAIFACNDMMAAGVLKAAAELRIQIPDELSVAGFDGSIIAEMVSPSLTTVHRPLVDMAYNSTSLLMSIIESRAVDWSADLSTSYSLVPRASTSRVENPRI